ncbi:hypothetical protein BKA70DRAFT_1220358 [Coprinopsis sp. MPI-PUGE-AT-0042]|nr:hypothetical protein BKA70DRAFT_1220358 [Coprinopsis sp. MPI-PUGE-AT-0042]
MIIEPTLNSSLQEHVQLVTALVSQISRPTLLDSSNLNANVPDLHTILSPNPILMPPALILGLANPCHSVRILCSPYPLAMPPDVTTSSKGSRITVEETVQGKKVGAMRMVLSSRRMLISSQGIDRKWPPTPCIVETIDLCLELNVAPILDHQQPSLQFDLPGYRTDQTTFQGTGYNYRWSSTSGQCQMNGYKLYEAWIRRSRDWHDDLSRTAQHVLETLACGIIDCHSTSLLLCNDVDSRGVPDKAKPFTTERLISSKIQWEGRIVLRRTVAGYWIDVSQELYGWRALGEWLMMMIFGFIDAFDDSRVAIALGPPIADLARRFRALATPEALATRYCMTRHFAIVAQDHHLDVSTIEELLSGLCVPSALETADSMPRQKFVVTIRRRFIGKNLPSRIEAIYGKIWSEVYEITLRLAQGRQKNNLLFLYGHADCPSSQTFLMKARGIDQATGKVFAVMRMLGFMILTVEASGLNSFASRPDMLKVKVEFILLAPADELMGVWQSPFASKRKTSRVGIHLS